MKKILLLCLLIIGQYINGQTIKLNIDAYSVVYNPLYNKAYVAVDVNDPKYPNSILQIDPLTGAVEKQISLQSKPFIIRQTKDQKYLYVSFQNQSDIVKVSLVNFTVAGTLNTGGFRVVDFAVLPADDNTLIVIRGDGSYSDDIVMYKAGILQPKQENTDDNWVSALCINNDGTRLYAHNRTSTGFDGQLANILDDGIEFTGKIWDYMIPGFSFIKNHNDLIYNESGYVLDPFTDSIPKLKALMPLYKINDWSRTGFEYSSIHGSYVYGNAINYKGYISFFHGEHYNYLGSYPLDGQVEIVYDLAVVDQDHFILAALSNSIDNKCLILYSANSKSKMVLQQKSPSIDHFEKSDKQKGNRPNKTWNY